jgi:hypothetical protein
MRYFAPIAAFLCLLVHPALADTSSQQSVQQMLDAAREARSKPVPKSIWSTTDGGDSSHLQSGLTCPSQMGDFQRLDVFAYKQSGLDVSCNYRNRQLDLITLYLTRRESESVADDFDEAKRELVQVTTEAIPLPDAQQLDVDSKRSWQRLIYSEHDGALHSGVWIADLNGWTLEYRATYTPADEAVVLAEMGLLTSNAEMSAGEHLSLCNKSAIPVRNGIAVTDKDEISNYSLMSGIVAAAGHMDDKASSEKKRTVIWCVENPVPDTNSDVLLWHGIFDDGSDASADRVTLMTVESPTTFLSAPDPDANQILSELNKAPKGLASRWSVTMQDGDKTSFFAYYEGRPDGAALARLMDTFADHGLQPLSSVSSSGKNITIAVPPKN